MDQADAVIIGAGVVGCAVALELSRRGLNTLSIDTAASAGAGATSNSSAVVRFSYSALAGVTMSWEGAHYWFDWANYTGAHDELGLATYHRCGLTVPFHADHEFSRTVERHWREVGIPFDVWNAETFAERFPQLDLGRFGPPARPDDERFWRDATDQLAGALFAPDGGYVSDPQLAAHNLQRAAEREGARFRFGTRVVGIQREAGRVAGVVLADGSTVQSSIVVNVAGPHSAAVNQMAGVSHRVGTRALLQEIHHVHQPTVDGVPAPPLMMADDDLGFYVRPDLGNTMVIGSIDPECDPLVFVDPDQADLTISDEQWTAQTLRASRRMPSLGVPHQRRGLVGVYDLSDDWQPILDRSDLDGYYMAIGSSGNMFKNAALAGHLMAELITAVEAGHDHDREPLHVAGRYTDCNLDLGLYARNRIIASNAALSVVG